KKLSSTFFLVPGYGAQGGTGDDVKGAFDERGCGAIVNSSRGIICAWKKSDANYIDAAHDAAVKMRDELKRVAGL
ncbi:MAG: orotidine 5'-phosphate decarboxylase, partial [Oscillospiraceae bacterium]|nr:orotidine 5'-phosphate decarboxylase [Oscillospiraceae bacterium]